MLILTRGEGQLDLCRLLGVYEPDGISVLALSDQVPYAELKGCSGESGHILHPLAQKAAFAGLMDRAAKLVAEQITRPGGQLVCFACKSGMHRSVACGVLLQWVLNTAGIGVELRHMGRRTRTECRCHEGPLRTHCPAVEQRLASWRRVGASTAGTQPRGEFLYTEHLRLRQAAFETAASVVRRAFGDHGLVLQAMQ